MKVKKTNNPLKSPTGWYIDSQALLTSGTSENNSVTIFIDSLSCL